MNVVGGMLIKLKPEDLGAVTESFSGACGCHVQPVVEEGGCVRVCFIEPETSLWKKSH